MGEMDCEIWELLSELNKNTTNFTQNGQCSNCGECCSHILPVSNTEIKRIRRYITKHHVKPHYHKYKILCPFRNEAEKKCNIYEVRPWICQRFICNSVEPKTMQCTKKLKLVNMCEIFK